MCIKDCIKKNVIFSSLTMNETLCVKRIYIVVKNVSKPFGICTSTIIEETERIFISCTNKEAMK